ncbi:MAG: histidine kinase dimerization/phospho-acceptor domain-containing protein, partial [Micrococcales bacterium]|nr:histidine kinase dimerization/phospho-acceptor domain-containing protein [Micrococcales bacterium]
MTEPLRSEAAGRGDAGSGTRTARRARGARSLRWRLGVLSCLMSCLILFVSGIGLVAMDYQRGEADRSTLVVEPAYDVNRSVRLTMVQAQSGLRGYLVIASTDPADATTPDGVDREAARMVATYAAAEKRIDAELDSLSGLVASAGFATTREGRARAYDAERAQRAAVTQWWQYARNARSSRSVERGEFTQGQQLFDRFSAANSALADVISAERDALRVSLRAAIVWASLAVVGATVLALGLAVILSWCTTSALTRPLNRLRDIVRRQRHGDRHAWAATDVGAVEVRELAGDVNALTASHHELSDRQKASLDVLRAQSELVRTVQSSDDVGDALRMVIDGIGEGLQVDRVVGGLLDEDGGFDDAVLWSARSSDAGLDSPWELRKELASHAERILEGERQLVVNDVSMLPSPQPPEQEASHTAGIAGAGSDWWGDLRGSKATGGLLVVPFGLGDETIGLVSLRTSQPRQWRENEIAFVHHVLGEVTRLVVKVTSERRQAEHLARLEELDRQEEDFMSTVSHELRTPLTSISGYLEMLFEGDAGELSEPQRRMLDVVGRNAQRLRGLIEDLLVLNRLEATGLRPETPVISVCEIVRDVAVELTPVAARTGISVKHHEREGSWVRGDQQQLT